MMLKISPLLIAAVFVAACAGTPGTAGSDGPDGSSSLVRLDEEAQGVNCETGGTAIKSGLDVNADGVLADIEVLTTRYVCNGSGEQGDKGDNGDTGAKALVRLEVEAPGANCEFGGTAVFAGVDANGNKELDAAEAGEPVYVCNGFGEGENTVWEGDYAINTAVEALALRGIRRITGDLEINDPGSAALAFPSLEVVDGAVFMIGNDTIESLALTALRTVGSDFIIDTNTALTSVKLPKLEAIGGALDVTDNPLLPTCLVTAIATALTEEPADGTTIEGNDEEAACE